MIGVGFELCGLRMPAQEQPDIGTGQSATGHDHTQGGEVGGQRALNAFFPLLV